jgi:hypothetical protein
MKLAIAGSHDPHRLNRRARSAAKSLGWEIQTLLTIEGDSILCLRSPRPTTLTTKPYAPVLISAGIHGDEPAAVEGLLQWLEHPTSYHRRFHFTVFPLLNPWGLRHNSRTDQSGRDLNRLFHRSDVSLIRAMSKIVMAEKVPYALTVALHEDYDAEGFYIYEITRQKKAWGHQILQAVRRLCPPDPRPTIDGRRARQGLMFRPKLKRDVFASIGLPEAPHHFFQGARRALTFETPSEFDLTRRAQAQHRALQVALQLLAHETTARP